MKIWHKILVAPAAAISFLMILGVVSYSVLTHQHSALDEVFKVRFGGYQLAANSAQEVTEVHANVYRLFTWVGNLKEDKIKQITNEQKAKIDAVTSQITEFSVRPGLDASELQAAQTLIQKLGKYKKDVDMAIDLSGVDVDTGMAAMQTLMSNFRSGPPTSLGGIKVSHSRDYKSLTRTPFGGQPEKLDAGVCGVRPVRLHEFRPRPPQNPAGGGDRRRAPGARCRRLFATYRHLAHRAPGHEPGRVRHRHRCRT